MHSRSSFGRNLHPMIRAYSKSKIDKEIAAPVCSLHPVSLYSDRTRRLCGPPRVIMQICAGRLQSGTDRLTRRVTLAGPLMPSGSARCHPAQTERNLTLVGQGLGPPMFALRRAIEFNRPRGLDLFVHNLRR